MFTDWADLRGGEISEIHPVGVSRSQWKRSISQSRQFPVFLSHYNPDLRLPEQSLWDKLYCATTLSSLPAPIISDSAWFVPLQCDESSWRHLCILSKLRHKTLSSSVSSFNTIPGIIYRCKHQMLFVTRVCCTWLSLVLMLILWWIWGNMIHQTNSPKYWLHLTRSVQHWWCVNRCNL